MAELNWSDAQWQKVKDAVTEAFGNVSVASAFLPCYGPLAGSTETIRNERVLRDTTDTSKIKLDADHKAANLRLVNVRVKVELSSEQAADETLSNALLLFRRAANILAQQEDLIVFDGYDPEAKKNDFVANNPGKQKGLADSKARGKFDTITPAKLPDGTLGPIGPALVPVVVEAISKLETENHPSPFASVLGDDLFAAAHEPSSFSLVLPSDRIRPLLSGPLLRSGKMDEKTGIVVSLASNAIDIVVGTPPTVQFLQRTEEGKFLFRVYTRFTLRIRDTEPPVVGFKTK